MLALDHFASSDQILITSFLCQTELCVVQTVFDQLSNSKTDQMIEFQTTLNIFIITRF